MEIPRQFTRNLSDPYEGLDFAERTSKITNADGSVVSEINEVLVPEHWSQVAADIMAQKYFRRAGVPALTRKRYESGIPEWMCPSEADLELLEELPESQRYSSETDARRPSRTSDDDLA